MIGYRYHYKTIADYISQEQSFWAISLATNWSSPSSPTRMKSILQRFLQECDEGVLGHHYYRRKRPPTPGRPCARLWGGFCIEKVATNPHFHGLVQTPPPHIVERMRAAGSNVESYLSSCWRGLVPSGTVCVERATDPEGWLDYMSKESATALPEDMIWTFEFWPARES